MFHGCIVEVESKILVHIVKLGMLSKWPLYQVLQKIRSLLSELDVSLSHIFREANSSADAMATAKFGEDKLFTSFELLPAKVKFAMCLDRLSVPYVRFHCVRE